jgi:hypothetical protein
MRDNWFIQGLITNGAWALLVAGGGGVVAYMAHDGSLWATPTLYGLGASTLLMIAVLCGKAIRRLPAKRPIVDLDNIEQVVRQWLDNFHTGVKNDPAPETYFRYLVTMDSGTKILVGRSGQALSGYLLLQCELTLSAEDQATLGKLSPEDLNELVLAVRLELARARVGYNGLVAPITTVKLFKRVPISEALNEDSFVDKLEELEAAFNAISIVAAKRLKQKLGLGVMTAIMAPASPPIPRA